MNAEVPFGIILSGEKDDISQAYARWQQQAVDWDLTSEPADVPDDFQTTIKKPVSITGPGTFFRRESQTLMFMPSVTPGWWFERSDLSDSLPIRVSVRNVWTAMQNIVLLSGSPHNYMRMVEHIIALRLGMRIDNVIVRVNSGDPPLFDGGSLKLVEAIESAGRESQSFPVGYVTVKEPVTVGGASGNFLIFMPAEPGKLYLQIDCAIDFPNAIGKQRIRFNLTDKLFRYGALARTNTTLFMKWYCQTIGKLFADIRNLGYTNRNILIAGGKRYYNAPALLHEGKSLEAVWHRSMLDFLAALSLIDQGRFVGKVISYRSGHLLDIKTVSLLYKHNLLKPVQRVGDTN